MPQNPLSQEQTPPADDSEREPFTAPAVEELGSLDALTMETISAGGGI